MKWHRATRFTIESAALMVAAGILLAYFRVSEAALLFLIPPVIIAALVYPRRLYVLMLAILACISFGVIIFVSTNVPLSLGMLVALTIYLGILCEAIYRQTMARTRMQAEIASLARFPSENPSPVLRVADGKVLYSNAAGRRLLEALGIQDSARVPEDWKPEIARALQSRERAERENRVGMLVYTCLFTPVADAGYVNIYAQDITEAKRAQESLRKSEEHYRHLVDNAHDIIYRTDAQGYFTLFNPTAIRLLKYSEAELKGRRYLDLVQPDYRRAVETFYLRQLDSDIANTYYEIPVVAKDGAEIWLGQNVQLVKEQDRVVGFQALARDVTERKQAECALQESETKNRALLDAIPDLMFILSKDGVFLDYHTPDPALLLQSPERFLGKDIREVMPRKVATLLTERFAQAQQTGETQVVEFPLQVAGKGHHYEVRLVALNEDKILAVTRDITARKQAEAEIERRLRETVLLNRVVYAAASALEPEKVLQIVCEELALGLNVPLVRCSLLSADDSYLTITAEHRPADSPSECGTPIPTANNPATQHVLAHHIPLAIADAQTDPRMSAVRDLTKRHEVISVLLVPLLIRDKVVGTIELSEVEPRKFSAEEVALTQNVAAAVSQALDNAQLYAAAQQELVERKRAEEALAQERNLLRTLIDNLPEYIYVKDRQSRYVMNNAAHLHSIGVQRQDEVIGKTSFDFHPRELAERYYADEQEVMRSGEPLLRREEHASDKATGRIRWHLTSRVPLKDSEGKSVGLVGMSQDITARKQAEELLKESEARLKTLLSAIQTGVMVIDAETHAIVDANDVALQLIGAPREQVVGAVCHRYVCPAEKGRCPVTDLGKSVDHAERVLLNARGESVPIIKNVTPITLDGRERLLETFVDITDRKRAEAELQAQRDFALQVMNLMGQGLAVTDAEDRFEYVNPTFAKMIGYSSEELIGRHSTDVTCPEDLAILAQSHARRVAGESNTYEMRLQRADGSPVHALITGVPRWRGSGKVGAIAVLTDLTERKQMEKALAQARDQAVEASRLKSEFLATMSHEIRTPMNSIIGMAEMLLDTPMNNQQREFAAIISNSAQSLLTIINDILDFSKIEAGKLVLDNIDFEPLFVVEGAAELLATKAREKRLALMTYVAPGIPRWLRGDPGRLRQILLNLTGNAVKFTEQGEVVVRADLQALGDDAIIRFAVSDTGIGLSPMARQRLFQPFTQADGSTTRRYGGTGLGLTISKHLVELMDGEISVESEEGRGTTFWFTARFQRSTLTAAPKRDLHGLRVLVVDDLKSHREIVHHYIASWGMRDGSASSGKEALEILRAAAAANDLYDLAVVDLMMPDMDGFGLAHLIKQDPTLASTRLILLTAFDARGRGEEALRAGFSAYLTKPVKQSHLFDAIANVMAVEHPPLPQPPPAPEIKEGRPIVEPQPPAAPAPPVAPGKQILLAEDNPINQKVAILQLQKLGYTAQAVTNGREVIEVLARAADQYALVLMDCQMPEMDGFAATRVIRKTELTSGRHIPIIAMTADALEGDRDRCIAAGMDDYLSKPVNLDNLRKVLEQWAPAEKHD